jgi:8-oxo-dGTP diphosphatase
LAGVTGLPRKQRVAAYAVIIRDDQILLSRIAPHISAAELWTLPGGGVDHGEHPRDALVREVMEETGLDAEVGETARVYSAYMPGVVRDGEIVDAHALRIVYDAWVATDAPEPRVTEVDGSTDDAAWWSLAEVRDGVVPVSMVVREALAEHQPFRRQRLAVYALIHRADTILLTRISARGFHTGAWTLPGGGVDFAESPVVALVREVREECGMELTPGPLLAVHDTHFSGTAPSGRHENFHGVHLIFTGSVPDGADPVVAEVDGTTDAVAWVPIVEVESGATEVLDVVHAALADLRRPDRG